MCVGVRASVGMRVRGVRGCEGEGGDEGAAVPYSHRILPLTHLPRPTAFVPGKASRSSMHASILE